jgi:bifunctional non-homologous end joining protein LigD
VRRGLPLEEYRRKRKFEETPEPAPKPPRGAGGASFVVQQHAATRMHWDLRLEIDGVLASWAVPKGPSLNPADKRLAVQTEAHPLDYAGFEGVIPEGNYGAGTVMVWDNGTYEIEGGDTATAQLARGDLKIRLHGHKLRGGFALVHSGKRATDPKDRKNWLLIKHRDEAADPGWDIEKFDWSVISGRTLDEIEAGLPARGGHAGELAGAREAPMPASLEPMLATLIERPFSDPDWLFELKWDGMRVLAFVRDGKLELRSRRGRVVTSQFPELEALPAKLSAKQAVVDGEVVVLDGDGRPDFGLMQQRMNVARPPRPLLASAPVIYYLFDVLYCDGYDLRSVLLAERKSFLKRILISEDPFRYSDHVAARGEDLYRLTKERQLEGIVGKRSRSRYTAGRSTEWVKLKSTCEVDAVVGGFTAARGGGGRFGALLLGLYEGPRLHFIGGCGSGFNDTLQKQVWARLEKIVTQGSPFAEKPQTREKAAWVKPALVARVKFAEWTRDKHLRAPVFLGLRTDVDPRECVKPDAEPAPEPAASLETELCRSTAETVIAEVEGRRLKFTHLDKPYFPEEQLTKRDLLCYYLRIAPLILPFLRGRPLVLRRMPEGMKGQLFYQKDAGEFAAEWMPIAPVDGVRYFMANDLAGLLYLTNLGCIDHNPWASRVDDLRHPDYLFVDLDPTEGTPYSTVAAVARAVNDVLTEIGIKAYLKTSGASGLHIFVPLERVYDFEQASRFTEIVSRVAAARVPDKVTFERIVEKRPRNRVLLDYSQLAYSRPLASVYSVRPTPNACVSAPITPGELSATLKPERFTIKTMPARLERNGDLWGDFWQSRQRIEPALERLRETLAR